MANANTTRDRPATASPSLSRISSFGYRCGATRRRRPHRAQRWVPPRAEQVCTPKRTRRRSTASMSQGALPAVEPSLLREALRWSVFAACHKHGLRVVGWQSLLSRSVAHRSADGVALRSGGSDASARVGDSAGQPSYSVYPRTPRVSSGTAGTIINVTTIHGRGLPRPYPHGHPSSDDVQQKAVSDPCRRLRVHVADRTVASSSTYSHGPFYSRIRPFLWDRSLNAARSRLSRHFAMSSGSGCATARMYLPLM